MENRKTSVVYIISDIDKALAFEWIATGIDKNKFELTFVLLNPGYSVLEQFLKEKGITTYYVSYKGKKDLLSAFYKVYKILRKVKPDIIHAHLFEASLIGLTAGKLAGISNRLFTRHHGNQHHIYFPKAVRYDKLINSMATHIIAPSESVKLILTELEGVKKDKVSVINHGFDLSYFTQPSNKVVEEIKRKYNPTAKWPVVGVISRYTELKGLQYIIPAFKEFLAHYPNALLILANAGGDYNLHVQNLLSDLNPVNYLEVPFEQNISSLYKVFDIFIHASVEPRSEAFGQTYVESLAAGVPSVFTLSGVATEFIIDRRNALVVPYRDSVAILGALNEILENEKLRSTLIESGKRDVCGRFELTRMISRFEDLYVSFQ